jgi:hypothetical protein
MRIKQVGRDSIEDSKQIEKANAGKQNKCFGGHSMFLTEKYSPDFLFLMTVFPEKSTCLGFFPVYRS